VSRLTVLIDGPSGAGKTTFADAVARRTGLRVVHLDDFYPGWSGLAEASRMVVDDVLHPTAPGYRRWNWETGEPADWVPLNAGESVIIEGVGAVTATSTAAARALGDVLTVRINAPTELRRTRALTRDTGYEPFWEMWAQQEVVHFRGPGRVPVDFELEW
jgi:adenylate kinase family enzyme